MSTLKKCGRLSAVSHGDRLAATGILSDRRIEQQKAGRRCCAAQRSRQLGRRRKRRRRINRRPTQLGEEDARAQLLMGEMEQVLTAPKSPRDARAPTTTPKMLRPLA
jgi:hypothetical protein